MINFFHSRNDALIDFVSKAQVFMTARRTPIQSRRRDNVDENLAIKTFCKENNFKVEYTPPDVPKLNYIIEHT